MSNNTSTKIGTDALPNFLDLLSEEDKSKYFKLRSDLDVTCGKRNRGHRTEAFDAILNTIRQFIEKGDENDWKRSLVCGVCWMDNTIAINTRQLRFLITKCKSSINGSLQRLGYLTNPSHAESWKMFISKIPFLKDNYNELRQWTIRCKNEPKPQQFVPTQILPVEISVSPIPFAPISPYHSNYCVHPISQGNNIATPIYSQSFIPVKVNYNAIPQLYPNYTDESIIYNNNCINGSEFTNASGNMQYQNPSHSTNEKIQNNYAYINSLSSDHRNISNVS